MNKKPVKVYTYEFKMGVIRDFFESGESKGAIARKWGLCSSALLCAWIKRYPIDEKLLSLRLDVTSNANEMKELSKEELLANENEQLKKALAYEKMRSRAFEKMIEIAEAEEGISILKKDGAKQ